MTLRKEKLDHFKHELLARKAILAKDLAHATTEIKNTETCFTDIADQASADADRVFALQMQTRDREILSQINTALRRIEGGTFGVCESCEEPISEARMKAQPATIFCIDCQAELESEKYRYSIAQ